MNLLLKPREIWDQQSAFSQQTFGSDNKRGPAGSLKHLALEVEECLAAPQDWSEYADAQLLLWDAARRAGMTFEGLMNVCWAKLRVNKAREWPAMDEQTADEPVFKTGGAK